MARHETVPLNRVDEVLAEYTEKGYRLVAVVPRRVPPLGATAAPVLAPDWQWVELRELYFEKP